MSASARKSKRGQSRRNNKMSRKGKRPAPKFITGRDRLETPTYYPDRKISTDKSS